MADAFRAFGLDPGRVAEASYPPGGLLGYLEVHIEQGPVLDSAGAPVGVVEAIAGQSRIRAEVRGRSGHAGTLPMAGRLDALAAAAELVLEIERLGRSVEDLRATVGTIAVEPGASNVVPGRARLSVDIRHVRDAVRMAAVDELRERAAALAVRRGVDFVIDREEHHAAVPADPSAIDLLCRAVERAGHLPLRLASGAGHDAAVMAAAAPIAMLFIRSPGGISHHPDESVRPEDVAVALDVMVRYLELVADRVASAGG
jgi:allantoate deiminase